MFASQSIRVSRAAVCALVVAAAIATPKASQAQTIFQQLFGLGGPSYSPPPAPRQYSPAPLPAISGPGMRLPDWKAPAGRGSENSSGKSGGGYRTVCVRTCDGFYFPISQSTSRGNFYRDADACRSKCGSTELRLFYTPASSPDMNEAMDLQGRAYTRLPNAFLYRKKLVNGCACKPEPWSATEINRHRNYAIAEGKPVPALPSSMGGVTVIAGGNYPDPAPPVEPVIDEPSAPPTAAPLQFATAAEAAPEKPVRIVKTEKSRFSRPEPTAAPAARKPASVAAAASQQSGPPVQAWFGTTTSKYSWPGDNPGR